MYYLYFPKYNVYGVCFHSIEKKKKNYIKHKFLSGFFAYA